MVQFRDALNIADTLIAKCQVSDIDQHYDTVKYLVEGTVEEVAYKEAMEDCINSGTAYKSKNSPCFLYYFKTDEHQARGIAFFGKNNPKDMLILFAGIFNSFDKKLNIIRFDPHNPKAIAYYKSLLMKSSVRRYYRNESPVMIRVDLIKDRIKRLANE